MYYRANPIGKRGATLLELAVTVAVLGVLAAAMLPVVNGSTDAFAAARRAGDASDRLVYAVDRIVRTLREAPMGTTSGTVGISAAQSSKVALTDGTELRLTGTVFELVDGTGTHVLATNVTSLTFKYLASDGVTSTTSTPSLTHSVQFALVSDGFELRSGAFCRVMGVSP